MGFRNIQEKLENNSKLCNKRVDFMNPDFKKIGLLTYLRRFERKLNQKVFVVN